jgi:hypothetical protein
MRAPSLKPFWRYFGGKYRAAPRYPSPTHRTIVEPFAGAAGYSLRYPDLEVVLVERYAVVAEMWRYLIRVKPSEVRRIPCVDRVDDLPAWVPQGARWLVGFAMNSATDQPCKTLSAGRIKLRSMGRIFEGWSEAQRERVASQVEHNSALASHRRRLHRRARRRGHVVRRPAIRLHGQNVQAWQRPTRLSSARGMVPDPSRTGSCM